MNGGADGVRTTGHAVIETVAAHGAEVCWTLNGAHIWPLYVACRDLGIPVYDTRHEQTAAFAAEAAAKLTRRPGLAALTAGPGVTNGISAITTAHLNGSPLVVLGGRAPAGRWGAGSLQELDHVPIVAPVTRLATTLVDPHRATGVTDEVVRAALTPHRGPSFMDIPMDVLFSPSDSPAPGPTPAPRGPEPDPDAARRAGVLLAEAERPAVIVGSDVWFDGATDALVDLVTELDVPTFANGLGRGIVPRGHRLSFARTRGMLRTDADVVAVIGAPLDFRLGFGRFGDAAVIHVADHPDGVATHTPLAVGVGGDLTTALGLMAAVGRRRDHGPWIDRLRDAEEAARAAERDLLADDRTPVRAPRVYGELTARLDPDAVVVCDGGDFVSWAGKLIDMPRPGRWLDAGPYGCLGTGMGYAMAARVASPDTQVVCLLGDGAAGFSLMDVDSLVRHNLPVVMVVGNNGIWGLEKHPMRSVYGFDIACDLRAGTRYDEVVAALGGAGETVEDPAGLGPALDRAFASGVPYLVNVICDPDEVYPRSSNLA